MPRRPVRRPRRRPARRPRRVARGLKAPRAQLKHYDYTFKLQPQSMISDLSGQQGVVIVNPANSLKPIQPTDLTLVGSSLGSIVNALDWSASALFRLSDIANYSDFTEMYDAYKINSVTVELQYLSNSAAVNGSGILPTFYMYWDQDDAIPPPTLKNILGKSGVKKWQPSSNRLTKKFKFVPICANVAQDAASLQPVIVPNKSQWIDCQSPNVPHYAFKMFTQDWLTPGASNIVNVVRVHYTYNVSFRSPLLCS